MKTARFLARRAPVAAILGPAAAASALLFASPAFAQATGPDLSSLTGAISVDPVISAILAVGTIMVGLALAVLGVRKVTKMIRG